MFFDSAGNSRQRIVLGVLIALLSVALGFVAFTPTQAVAVFTYGGYWFVISAFALFCAAIGRIVVTWWREYRFARADAGCAALVLGCGVLLQIHEPHGFKILMDEIMLLGASMSLHLDKTPGVPIRGADLQGGFQLLTSLLDKRPLFFPVLVSVVHDLTGYRPANALWVNAGLIFVFLGLVFGIGRRFGGRRGGVLAVLLLTSLPLLAQNATGGGFDLLNVTLQAAFVLLAIRALERKDDLSLSACCLTAVLLADTRYESVVFILPAAAIVGWRWWRERRVRLTWAMLLCPLLLVTYPLQYHVFDLRVDAWDLSRQPGFHQVFSPGYIYDNVGHALAFFFDIGRDAPNSPLLAGAGLIALVFLAVLLAQRVPRLDRTPPEQVVLVFVSVAYAIATLVLFCYFWGKIDDPPAQRLSLPLHLFMTVAIVFVLSQARLRRVGWNIAIAVVVTFIFGWSIPLMARHGYTEQYSMIQQVRWEEDFIARHPTKDYLVVDNASIIWITHEVSSTPIPQARARKAAIDFLLRNQSVSAIYAVQHIAIDPKTRVESIDPDEQLDHDFVLQTVEEHHLKPIEYLRLSRITGVKQGAVSAEDKRQAEDLAKLTPEEREKLRRLYFEKWLKQLP